MQTPVEVPATQFLRTAEACALARCSRSYLFRLVKSGKITPSRPSRRMTLYRRDELEQLIEAARAPRNGCK